MENLPQNTKDMIQRGQDPKEMLMEACKPECKHWFDKLSRCEAALKSMKNADPEMSCMYPLRDWVTCLEGCVQPKIQKHLVGNERSFIS